MIRFAVFRLHRRGLFGFSIGGFLVAFFYGLAFLSAAGKTPAERAAFGRATMLVAKEFAFIVPVPVHPETLGGFEQYKWLPAAAVMMMLWAGVAGVGIGRGDEERGLTDEWLAGGLSRAGLLLNRSAAFFVVLLVACFASVIGISAVAPAVQQDPNVAGEIGKALTMTTGLFSCYAIALLIAQLPPERGTATALGIGALVLLFVVNGIADTVESASGIGLVSPFHWMEHTTSAAPGGTFDVAATLGLAAVAVVLIAGAVAAFQRRDVGSGLFAWGRHQGKAVRVASRNPLLSAPALAGLWEQRIGLGAWAAATLGLGAVMVAVTRSLVDALFSAPHVAQVFETLMPGPRYASMLGYTWLSITLLILAGYAVVQASRWAAQEAGGRMEMLLSAPVSRSRVVIERALEFALASLLIVVAGYLGVLLKLPGSGVRIDPLRILFATALLWPFALAFGGFAVAVATRWPRIAVPLLAGFAFVEYFLGDLAPLFKAPSWVANLSIFHLYGNPLVDMTTWSAPTSMVLVFLLGFAASLLLIQRRDVSTP